MSSSSRRCASTKCEFFPCARCHCCDQDLCLDHIREHKDQLNIKLIPLTDQINTLSNWLEHLSSNFDELDKWRREAHQTIDDFCGRLQQQFSEERKKKPREQLQEIQTSLALLLQREGATRENIESLTKSTDCLRQQLNELQKSRLTLKPLTIDKNLILISTSDSEQETARNRDADCKITHTGRNKRRLDYSMLQEHNVHHAMQQSTKKPNESFDTEVMNRPEILVPNTLLTVFIRVMEKMTSYHVPLFDSILQLKQKIEAKEGIPVQHQRLTFVGKTLKDDYCLATTDIQNRSTLDFHFVNRMLSNEEQRANQAF